MNHSRFLSRLSLGVLTFLGLIVSAQAIIDTNENGMSDIWERLHNEGELFDSENPDHAPHADPDNDGITNLQESIIGSNPFEAEPMDQRFYTTLQSDSGPGSSFKLSFLTNPRKQYSIHYSFDLATWQTLEDPIFGTRFWGIGHEIEYGIQAEQSDGTVPPRLFWRAEVLDGDSDGDGLTDWEESILNLDPRSPMTIQGIPDLLIFENFYSEIIELFSYKNVIDQLDLNIMPTGSPHSALDNFLGKHFEPSAPSVGDQWISLRGSGEKNLVLDKTKTIILPKGESALFAVAVASQEYPVWTDPDSSKKYNDELTWEILSMSDSNLTLPTTSHLVEVNCRHKKWKNSEITLPGLDPAHFEIVEFVTAPAEADLTLEIKLTATNIGDSTLPSTITAGFIPVAIVPDYDRDGMIDDSDYGKITPDNPFRWWVNDDDDEGEAAGGKQAKGDIPNNGTADHQNNVVDGMRDLVDFFPLHLDIKTLLDIFPASKHTYRLKHSENAFKFIEIPEIVPDGDPETDGAGSFIRSLDRAQNLAEETVKTASASGETLTQAMLDASESGEGILLLEAAKETTEPLQLEILNGTESIATIDLPVRISKVEDMYRHVDLRGVPTEYDGSAITAPSSVNGTKTADPGAPYPDERTNGKYFAFIHGYNVSQDKARGWHAELFKRMHQMGSKARYVGIVWQGDTGLDYHKAVFQALQTGDQLNAAMSFIDRDLTIAAHSLGNMVVSHAIQNGGFAPDRYYLINAAVPREAYGGSIPPAERTMMIENGTQLGNNGPHWRKWCDYDGAGQSRLLAPEWHTLFPANDNRSKLTWNGAFEGIVGKIYNFYSKGDEVVRNPINPTASAWALILDRGFDFSTYAWANQEYVKGGTSLVASFMERTQGGWVYNYAPPASPEEGNPAPAETWATGYFKYGWAGYRKYTPTEARDELTKVGLRAKPFFKPFLEQDLFDAANGSTLAGQPNVKYDLLARGIPALSYAAAANLVERAQGNFDMEAQFRTDPQRWPLENHQSDEDSEDDLWEDKWLHSDFKNVALSHVYQMFTKMIEIGELNQ